MTTLLSTMTSKSFSRKLETEESPDPTAFATPVSTPSGNHTPAAGYRTAAGTLSAAFASLWGTYKEQQREAGPSRSPSNTVGTQAQTLQESQNQHSQAASSVPGGWGNLLNWGPTAARQQHGTSRKDSASPSRAAGQRNRSRGAIPFNISAPLEATSPSNKHVDANIHTDASTNWSPTSSPRRKPLQGVFDDMPPASPASSSPSAPRSPSSPRRQLKELSNSPMSPKTESASGAYATLSRLHSKPSTGTLRSGSGFLWSSSAGSGDMSPSASQHRPAANWSEAIARAEKLDSYVRRIVFQAGLDFETRPMVVLAACCLPDPKEVDYDALLDRIMDTMDLFVENDYTVIYFAGGGKHRPGWNWIWRAYRRLGRKFRKNLKKLYIVHPTFFTRSLLQFVNTGAYFVSPKFSKKVSQLYTLSALAEHVPLTQIDIPPEVLQWNLKYEKQVTLPRPIANQGNGGDPNRVFGVDLVQLMGEYGESGGVPRVVRDCVEAILGDFDGIRPCEVEGIFRRSPSSALLKTAQESYDRGHPVSLAQYQDPHIPAVLLKVFLRSLPRPIFHQSLYPIIRACPPPPKNTLGLDDQLHQVQSQETIEYLRAKLLPSIQPACSAILLSFVLEMLHRVSQHSDTNKMDAANLATVIAPNLVSSGNAMKDVMICRVEGIGSMASSTAFRPQQQQQKMSSIHSRKASISSSIDTTHNTTLGSILRFCIERYYEIFDQMSFSPQVNSAQGLVDDLGRAYDESRSPSVQSRVFTSSTNGSTPGGTAGLGIDSRRAMHQRGSSVTSTGSGFSSSQPASPWVSGMAFTPTSTHFADDDDEDKRSIAASRSITSREGYRAPGGVHRSTVGRNSSGSLRLTKGRLGSNNNLRGSFTPSSSSGLARSSGGVDGLGGGGSSAAAVDTEGLTSQLSGVTLNGVTATGMFSSPLADRTMFATAQSSPYAPGNENSTQASHLTSTPFLLSSSNGREEELSSSPPYSGAEDALTSPPTSPSSAPAAKEAAHTSSATLAPVRRKSLRRELSEVVEASDTEE